MQSSPPPRERLSRAKGMVERMYGGLGNDYLCALAAMADAGVEPAIVAQAAKILRDRLVLAERAQHCDESVSLTGAVGIVSQDRSFNVVDVAANGHPTQAA